MSNDSTKPPAGKPHSTRPGSPGLISIGSRQGLERPTKVASELGAGKGSTQSGDDGSPVADLVSGGRGAEKPRVFLWEAGAACVRVVGSAAAPLFVGKDVCDALGYTKYRDALALIDTDERVSSQVDTLGGPQEMTCVTESGFYALAFGSRKEQARVFRKWVTSEVLPQIRKTGAYTVPAPLPPPRDIWVSQTFSLPPPASTEEAMIIDLICEVMRHTRTVTRDSVSVHGHTIADIARKDGAFHSWFGPHEGFQSTARFFKNLSRYFDRPIYRPIDCGYDKAFGIRPHAHCYIIHPERRNRQRRYILTAKKQDMPLSGASLVPAPLAVAIVDAALKTGGEAGVK
jgi:hypothetical protein